MKKKITYISLVLLAMFLSFGCDDGNNMEETEILSWSNGELVDLGRVNYNMDFKMERRDSVVRCEFKTKMIKKGDTIQEIRLWLSGRLLEINVISAPYDFDCTDDSCFTAHLVTFDIDKNLIKGVYDIDLAVNNGYNRVEYELY